MMVTEFVSCEFVVWAGELGPRLDHEKLEFF
jgi:hypothetical protein